MSGTRSPSVVPRSRRALAKEASTKERIITKDVKMQVFVDGPYGSPCREIFDTEHVILIGSGIGVTPFAAILQSITYRFKAGLVTCPMCMYSWCHAPRNLMNLKKVDFVWINRDQSHFEWFSSLICNIEKEQLKEASLKDAVTMHMFMTAAPNQYEVNGVGVQMALDLVHNARKTDLLTGLSTRTQGGRPDFDKVRVGRSDGDKGEQR
ncbi:NADPH oxidase 5 [Elysia marginata]|uniref:NADPH oxidase 5 n=1 Tax=Elysia marginata TaxID=1093978 RepID=A0AAV4IUJ3_9GAST|nr:NADPH oxidase 5 [Elysia marginata]